MIKRILAVCKKGTDKGRKVKKGLLANRKRVCHVLDGGTVTFCNHKWLMKKSAKFRKSFGREAELRIQTNIEKLPSYALLSQMQDYWIEHTLKSGGYTFFDMFIIKNPFGEAPLTAVALFTTPEPCRVRVTVKGDIPETDISSEFNETKFHRIPILGLYAGRENQVHFELLDEAGKTISERRIPVKTKVLPKDLRDVITVKKVSENPVYKNILISGGVDIKTCVFDRQGQIRYYLRRKPKGYGIFPLSDGRFLFMEREISAPSFTNPQSVQMYDMDYLGRVYKTYLVRNGAHHTVEEKTLGGNIMTAGSSMEGHSEDLILELDRESGKIVKKVKLGDIFDDTYQDMMDWAHINSASYQSYKNAVLVSMRNIHSISSIDWKTGEMRWLLADPRFWEGTEMADKLLTPIGDVPWFYQQHAVFELEEDLDGNPDTKHLIVFDNHWHKRRKVEFFDKDKKTYISFYTINEKERTVSFMKRFPCPKSKIRSNAILCGDENRLYAMAGSLVKPIEDNIGLIREYDFETSKVLSEFYVKPGFFRAHEFKPEIASLAKPLLANRNYIGGDLKRPELLAESNYDALDVKNAKMLNEVDITLSMTEDILYVREIDHHVRKVYLFGKNANYFVEFADTYQTMKTFEEAQYSIAMWLETLPEDKYQVYLDVSGELCNTGKYVAI